tara:strand:- start:9088 stop:10389 length:1302 start_codon:yes stop_codon:yes gene_type:complete
MAGINTFSDGKFLNLAADKVLADKEEKPEKKISFKDSLYPSQQEVHDSEARWKILCAGRRFGKSRLGVQMAMEHALNGKRAWWVAPTFSIARVGWRDILNASSKLTGIKVDIKVGDMVVNFPDGGFIAVKSADNPQRLRGEGLDFLVMDEAAFVKEETWTEVLRPTLTERKGSALFISTPRGMNNWFYRLWVDSENKEDWERFKFPTIANPRIDPEEIESAKAELGSITFAQEYEAEFVNETTQIFKADWFKYYKPGVRSCKIGNDEFLMDDMHKFATVDLAVSTKDSADYTVITSFAHDSATNNLFVTDMFRDRLQAPDIIPTLKKIFYDNELSWVGIERAGYQLAIVQFAQREGIVVKELKADKDKRSRAMPLSAKFESGQIYFPDDELATWVGEAERELITFPVGSHDDIVDTLAYGVLNLNNKREWVAY